MLMELLRGSLDFYTAVTIILVDLLVIFLILPFHEWAHAFAASLLGDKGIKQRGRLTLNPLSHVDPIGALAIIFVGFGWAKPVEIDPRNFKNPKVGMGISALAGPLANFLAAIVGGFIFFGIAHFAPSFFLVNPFGEYVRIFLSYYITLNISLAVFNLVPIPPLDGSKILFMFLPDKWVYYFYKYENYFFFALIALVWFDILPIAKVSGYLLEFVIYLSSLPFTLLG